MNPQLKLDLDHIVKHAEPLLRELDNKTIFMTGDTGFYGKWMRLALDHAETVIDGMRCIEAHSHRDYRIQDLDPYLGFSRDGCSKYDYLLHFAHDHDSVENNIVGMKRVLDFAVDNKVKKVLFASSGAVDYAQHINTPKGKLGATKLLCEAMGCEYARKHGFDFLISRGYSFVGPMMNLDRFAIGQFIKQGLAGGPIRVENPSAVRSYMHAADLVINLLDLLANGGSCIPHFTGSPKPASFMAVSELVDKVVGVRLIGLGMGYIDIYAPPTETTTRVTIELEEAIARTVNYYRLER